MSKNEKVKYTETIEKRFITFNGEKLEVKNAFSHEKLSYVTLDILTEDRKPYTICDKYGELYDSIEKVRVPK
jgi:hypothetical protein